MVCESGKGVSGWGRLRHLSQELWEHPTASPWVLASPGGTLWEALLLEERQPLAREQDLWMVALRLGPVPARGRPSACAHQCRGASHSQAEGRAGHPVL